MNNLKNLLLSIFSVIVFLTLIELFFRLFFYFNISYNMEMHKYALSLKKKSDVYGLTHEHIPNSSRKLMGVDISLNGLGMRDDYRLSDSLKYKNKVLVLGSSITMGWGVKYNDVFTTRLQNSLNENDEFNFNIINSGIGNYNTKFESILFEKNYNILNPDMVILHYFINDAEIISNKSSNFIIKNSFFAAYTYLIIQQIKYKSNNFKSLGEYYLDMYKNESIGWSIAKKSILSIKNKCELINIPFLVVIQPDLHNLNLNSDQKKCHEIINSFLIDNSIEYIDLFNSYSKTYKDNPKKLWVSDDDPHPNKIGHQIIYKDLLNFFKNK